jgi:hypothetical protein
MITAYRRRRHAAMPLTYTCDARLDSMLGRVAFGGKHFKGKQIAQFIRLICLRAH